MDSFESDLKYENRIVPEDRDKLISLLEEYSAKLRKKCDYIDKNFRIFKAFLFSVTSSIAIISAVTCISLFAYYSYKEIDSPTYAFIYVVSCLSFLFSSIALAYLWIYDNKLRRKNTITPRNYETHALAHRLNKLVGIASEFYEHVEKKAISKIELDLKISEAESVLNYYDSIVGKPKKYSDKKRD
jgi:hypothetical protein